MLDVVPHGSRATSSPSLLFAGFHAAAAAVAPTGPWRTIGRPAAHTLVEAIRLGFPFGGVPLATLGISQAGGPLLGIARVGGVILITWVVFQVGCRSRRPGAGGPALPRKSVGGDRRDEPAATASRTVCWRWPAIVVLIVLVGASLPKGTTSTGSR